MDTKKKKICCLQWPSLTARKRKNYALTKKKGLEGLTPGLVNKSKENKTQLFNAGGPCFLRQQHFIVFL